MVSCSTTSLAIILAILQIIFIRKVSGESWFSIPLKLAANQEHFITTMSFGSPVTFELDIVMDTGSGSFHIYPNINMIPRPHDTSSFECICQAIAPNSQTLITEINDTWYQFVNHSNGYSAFLEGCPLWNETYCDAAGQQCSFGDVLVYNEEQQRCNYNEGNMTHVCKEKVCRAQQTNYQLIINGETAAFECGNKCYSALDIISFAHTPYEHHNYVSYVYSDRLSLDSNRGHHNITLFTNKSWANGTIGLVYDYEKETSFWQVLGLKAHSALLAFDTIAGQIDVGNVSNVYLSRIAYSEHIWWQGTYHYLYIYSLSVCNVDLFELTDINIGAYYLAMIDTGAACLTLPPELFDVLFNYIPHALDCDGNQTFCYIPNAYQDIDIDIDDEHLFPMLSFKLSMRQDEKIFYISLKDLVIRLAGDKGIRYCIERGTHSIDMITKCTPDPDTRISGSRSDCTANGVIIFGTKTFRSLYTIFDFPNRRIGFANNILLNYTQEVYKSVNERSCKQIPTECIGDDVLNATQNACQSAREQCESNWGWKYSQRTHYCVLKRCLYFAIPFTWIFIMMLLLFYIKAKTYVDRHIFYSAIKV